MQGKFQSNCKFISGFEKNQGIKSVHKASGSIQAVSDERTSLCIARSLKQQQMQFIYPHTHTHTHIYIYIYIDIYRYRYI